MKPDIHVLPVTIGLGLLAIAVGLVIALPVGIYSAITEASLSFLGVGLPSRFRAGAACSAGKDASTWRWRHGWLSGPVCA